jgi:hypothetical protein
MSRAEKIKKLGNAIREYRGQFHPRSEKWIYTPKPAALERVKAWVSRLGLDVQESVQRVNGFKSFAEFHNWISSL